MDKQQAFKSYIDYLYSPSTNKKKMVMHKFADSLKDKEQRKIFARVYNSLHEAINKKEDKE